MCIPVYVCTHAFKQSFGTILGAMRTKLLFGTEGAFDHILRGQGRFWRDRVPSLIHSFTRYLLSVHCVQDAGAGNYRISKTDRNPSSPEACILLGDGRAENKQINER